jgi:DNA end-binding protein Ku
MAARATWKGYLKVSLVNIPIRVFPATDSAASVSFNQLHAECQTRIQQKKWCPHCEREVTNAEIVKGYEFEKGRYVVVSEEDIEKVRPASTRVIDLQQFAERDELDPIFFERPYYLAPDTQVAADAFAVIREGMQGKVGIGKVALYGREYLVAVEARDKGLVMYTLRQADEIRAMADVSEYDLLPEKPKAAEVQLARQVISTFEKPLDMKQYQDEYQAELRRIIDAKVAGEEVVATEEETPSKVVDLMEALRKSLANVSDAKKKPAKADIAAKEAKAPAAKKAAPKRKAG